MTGGFDVEGMAAVVTGGTRGIGAETARRLLHAGAAGVVVTGRDEGRLADAWSRSEFGNRVVAVAGSVQARDHPRQVVDAALEAFGRCDIVVNNAGANPGFGPLMDVEEAAIDETWAVNQRAPLMFVRAAWHAWMAEHGGAVVNVSSAGGADAVPTIGAYGVAKAALLHMTRQLAHELAPGVRVNAVVPGIVKTTLSQRLWRENEPRAAAVYPLQRVGEPGDVASAIVFLCSRAASWVTGVALPVDGGLTQAAGAADSPILRAAAARVVPNAERRTGP